MVLRRMRLVCINRLSGFCKIPKGYFVSVFHVRVYVFLLELRVEFVFFQICLSRDV